MPDKGNGFTRAYFWVEDKYYDLAEKIEAAGIPVYEKYIQPVEKRGIPSFPLTILVLLLVAGGAFALLAAPTSNSGEISFYLAVTDDSNGPVAAASILVFQGERLVQAGETDENGVTTLVVPREILLINVSKGELTAQKTVDAKRTRSDVIVLSAANSVNVTPGTDNGDGAECPPGVAICFQDCTPNGVAPCSTATWNTKACTWDADSCNTATNIRVTVEVNDAETGENLQGASVTALDANTNAELEHASGDGKVVLNRIPANRVVRFSVQAPGHLETTTSERQVTTTANYFTVSLERIGSENVGTLDVNIQDKEDASPLAATLKVTRPGTDYLVITPTYPQSEYRIPLEVGPYVLRASSSTVGSGAGTIALSVASA